METRKRTFKCSECNVVKKTIKELNTHHEECHNPQICGVCGKLFKLASSLTRHMYEHNKPRFSCDQCDFMSQFESELTTHKIVHHKNPSHQCMKANCMKWFMRKSDLTLHLQKHEGVRHNCDHDGCSFMLIRKNSSMNTARNILMIIATYVHNVAKVSNIDQTKKTPRQ